MYESPYAMLGGLLEDDSLGARYRRPARGGAMTVRDHRMAKAERVAMELARPAPGVPGVQAGLLALGWSTVQFNDTSNQTLRSQSFPQKPIKGQRLVVDLARSAGAFQLVTITQWLMGSINMLLSSEPIGLAGFRAEAFQTMIDLVPVGPGDILTIDYTISATVAAGETIDISTTLYGPTLVG